jgi:hypothetical protein
MRMQDPPASGISQDEDDVKVLPMPVLRDDGEPSEVLWQCPDNREVDFETFWYHLADVPDILICTQCHESHIAGTALSQSFERVRKETGRCRFNVPRLTKALIPEARRTKDLQPINEYLTKREQIKDCMGLTGATGEENIRWYMPVGGLPSNFIACEACYEDRILGTAFASNFEPSKVTQRRDETWACDMCLPYISQALIKLSKRPNGWNDWVAAAAKRMTLPQCDGKAVDAASRAWFRPRREVENMVICEACYLDKAGMTVFAKEIEPVTQKMPGTGSQLVGALLGTQEEVAQWSCDMQKLSVGVAWDAALGRKDFNIFHKAATTILANVPCTDRGICGGTWYTLAGGCNNFDVCTACYAGIIEPFGLERFFQSMTRPLDHSVSIICDFNLAGPKFMPYMLRLTEAIDVGVWSIFSAYVQRWAAIPNCPGYDLTPNMRWYGYGDLTICPSCWETFAKGTPLEANIILKNELIAESRMCCLYSPRMRGKWTEASAKYEKDGKDAVELVEFSRLRLKVYQNTVLQIKFMREMQQMKMTQAMHNGLLSTMYKGMESIRIASGATDGYLHGGGNLGWHETSEGATSAGLFNQMQQGMNQANSPNTWMAMAQMEAQWREVE